MFTEKCFIRKNNPQLLKDLADLGYNSVNNIVPCFKNNHRTECKYIKCDKDNAESIVSIYDSSMNNWIDDYDLKNFIDCGEDTELFLAIAAISDDSDYMQYFVTEDDGIWYNLKRFLPKGSFILCLVNDRHMSQDKGFYNNITPVHKATAEELIKHFKRSEGIKIRNF